TGDAQERRPKCFECERERTGLMCIVAAQQYDDDEKRDRRQVQQHVLRRTLFSRALGRYGLEVVDEARQCGNERGRNTSDGQMPAGDTEGWLVKESADEIRAESAD